MSSIYDSNLSGEIGTSTNNGLVNGLGSIYDSSDNFKSIFKTAPATAKPKTPNLIQKAGQLVANKANQVVPGGVSAGIQRVKQTPLKEYFLPTSTGGKPFREYLGTTAQLAKESGKGILKMTPQYLWFRAATGNPVTPMEYGLNLITTPLNAAGTYWRTTPIAPILGTALGSWTGVRKYLQGNISNQELLTYPEKGLVEQPFVGELITDNAKTAQLINTVFFAGLIFKGGTPFLKQRLNKLNLRAEELSKVSKTLEVRPNSPMSEVSKAFKSKIKEIPEAFIAKADPKLMKIRQDLTESYNILKRAGFIDKQYATAWDWVQKQLGKPVLKGKAEMVQPKQLPAEVGTAVKVEPKINKVTELSKTAKNSLENNQTGIKEGSIERAIEEIKSGNKPPVKIRRLEDGTIVIEDGRHHLEAAKQLGLVDYPIEDVTDKYIKLIETKPVEPKTFYRGGGETISMPKKGTAQDVINYEVRELGNQDIKIEPGINLTEIPSKNLMWLTETSQAAKEYGKVTKVTLDNYRIVARDSEGGVLVEKLTKEELVEPTPEELEVYQDQIINEVKQELEGTKTTNPDDPTNQLLKIADQLSAHFKAPKALYKIVGAKRTYTTPEGKLTVGGNAQSAFDNLIFATDIEGFAKNIKVLAVKFDKTFTEISDMIKSGNIDGADYEKFKQRFSQEIASRKVYTGKRGGAVQTRPVKKPEAKPSIGKTTVTTKEVKPTTGYGFKPKNLEEPESPQAVEEVKEIIKKSEIAQRLSQMLDVPIRRGKFRSGNAIGIFKPQEKIVRIKSGGLHTVFHEVGHYIDNLYKLKDKINVKEANDLLVEYGGKPKDKRLEAFAEFIRYRLTGQENKIDKYSPEFKKEFDKWLETVPEVKEVLETAQKDYQRWQAQPASAKVLSHLSIGSQNKGNFIDRVTKSWHDLYTSALDDLHPLSEYVKIGQKALGEIEASKNPYLLARNIRGWIGSADLFLNKGTFGKRFWKMNSKGKIVMDFKGKSLADILKPVDQKDLFNELRVYLTSKRTLELNLRGIKTGISAKDAKDALAELEKKYPNFDFDKVAKEIYQYTDDLLNYAKEHSLIGDEGYKLIKELNKFYVPFYRVMEETNQKFLGKKKLAGNLANPIKKIKGSEREIIDPLESIIKSTYSIINAAQRNEVGIAMANLANRNYELGRLFEEVARPMIPHTYNVVDILEKVMKEADVELPITDDMATEVVTMFSPTRATGANMLNVNMGDDKKVYQVDPDLYKAIQGLEIEDMGVIARILSLPAKVLRAGATLSPDFSVRNPFRDQFSALVYSNYGFVPGVDLIRGMYELFKKGDVYNLWKAGGGERSMTVSLDRDILQKNLKDILKSKKALALDYVKNPLSLLQTISEFGEVGTRLGEMRRALRKGADPLQAAYASREVTLDFARIGAKTRAINSIIAFFNANLQGTDKFIRSFKSKPFRTLYKVLMGITLPSILLYFANRDDKRWKEIPKWQKDLFWIIFTPNHIARVPKPFELGIIFGSVPERTLEYLDEQDPQAFNQLKNSIASGFSPGFIPTALLPVIENITNYSFFLERPIVSAGQENLPPEAQAGTYTSELAKLIGGVLKYSPSKIDNLVYGWSGGLGRYAVSAVDKILAGTGIVNEPPPPAINLEDTPVIKAFMIRNPVGSSSESVNQLYTMYGKTTAEVAYVKKLKESGQTEKANQYIKDHPEIIYASSLSGAVLSFSKMNKQIYQIRNSRILSPTEKRDKINKISQLQTEIAAKLLDEIKNK